MRILVVGLIALALLAAGGTAFLAKRFLDSQKPAIAQAEVKTTVAEKMVIVADRDLPAGTVINRGALRWQFWPEDQIRSEFASAAAKDPKLEERFTNQVARRGIAAGTPLVEALLFKPEKAGFLAGALEPGMRAVAVAVSATSGAAGFIIPGDRVDVILTFELQKVGDLSPEQKRAFGRIMLNATSETIIENIRVIAVDQKVNDFEDKAAIAKTVTLEVSPKQAETLAVAVSMGTVSLALRSRGEADEVEDKPPFVTDVQASPTLQNVLGGLRTPGPRSDAPRASGGRVKVYRGGSASSQDFGTR